MPALIIVPWATLVLVGAAWLGAEMVHSWASRRLTSPDHGGSEAVLVLGYRDAGPRAGRINRWRVRAGLRSLDGRAPSSRVIFCGGCTTDGEVTEAALMAHYARDERGFAGVVVLEDRSRTTWENIANALPLIEDVDRIKIASMPLHALKARLYLRRQRPDLARRLVRGADHRWGEFGPLTPVVAVHGLVSLARTYRAMRRRSPRSAPGSPPG